MKTTMTKAALRGATCLSFALLGSNAFAQDAAPAAAAPQAAAETADAAESIVVTGSRISTPNLQSANPVAIVTGEQIFSSGNLSVGDQLNELPMLRSTYSQANSTRFLGTRGLNLLDLRGLGTQRTLVLVNGRRHVGSDVLVNGTSVDVNTIPADLIDRVDVVTGGASGVYGSDAIAGVVNFILKEDYDGLKMRAQNGVSNYGDAGKQYISVLAGKNFADGRGNITFSGEFSHSADFYASDRPGLSHQQNFIVTDTDPAGSVNGSDGVPDRTFYTDVRSATISLGGLVAVGQGSNRTCGRNVSNFSCTYLFQSDGTLVPQTGERIGIGPNGNFQGGNGMSGREGQLVALSPDLKRYTANLTGHYEISPALVPFFEAKYSRTDARGSQSGPFFSQGTTLGDPGGRERVRLDNPYLSTQARDVLTAAFLATPGNVNGTSFADVENPDGSITTAAAQLAAQRAAIAAGTYRFNLRRNWTDFGNRDEDIRRETYRIVAGLRGDFNDDWHYEVSANYGQHRETNVIRGNVNVQRYLLALDSTRDASGNIVCRSKLNPAGTISYLTGKTTGDPRLASDIASCVPLNPFGQGSVSQAAKDYILMDSVAHGKMTQLDLMGFVSGDTSAFFNLPGGPVSFSVGGEYRRETVAYDLDEVTQAGYAFYNAIPSFSAPAFKVKEAYGEILLPILADVPFFKSLSVRGNGRISDYAGSTGTVYTYGGETIWSPVSDIKLRATYSRSVRAPNLSELYSAQGQNFAPGFVDPCSERNLATGSANRVANCTAAGRPANYDFVYAQSLEIVSGGNPDLKEETSDSITLGAVLQPHWIPGLSISVDYWNIKVKNVISSVDAQQIADLCYDSSTLSNPFCGLFKRAGASGGPAGEVPFQILEGSLLQSQANFAKLKYRGIDTQINYDHSFDFGRLSLQAYWTHYLQKDSFTDPSDPTFKDRFIDELNDPSDEVSLNASFESGPIKFTYGLRWIDKMYLNTYEDYNALNGSPPQNTDYAPIKKYPDVFYHDFRLQYSIAKEYDFYLGVDNAFNKMPPYGLTGVGGGSSVYQNMGRYFYAGITANF